jgi:hypothetical protein
MSLLPLATNSAPGVSLYAPASGGGGGGGGPNPAFSTITINDGVLTTNSGANGFVFQNSTTPVIQDAFLQSNTVPLAAGTGTANVFQLNSASGSNATLTIGAGNDDACYVWTGLGGNQSGSTALFLQTAGLYTSSLNVSSINGAVPGGGGGIQSTIANGAANISIPAGAVPMSFNLTEGASFTTPGNAGNLLFNGNIINNATAPAGFNGGLTTTALTASTLTLSDQPTALSSIFQVQASDANLYVMNVADSNASLVSELSLGFVGGRNQLYINSNAQIQNQLWVSSIQRCSEAFVSSFNVSSINGAVPNFPSNLTASTLTLTGGANSIELKSDNTATATIWATGAGGLTLSTVTTLNSHIPVLMNPTPTQQPAFLQSGYCQDVPYGASTILFSIPYTTDSIAVYLTPTNRNTSGGANPNISLGNNYGPAGRGVSSIGFEVDTRNNGVGYNGSFFWMAMPTNQ